MASSRYDQVIEWLYSLEARRGMDFKLDRTASALAALGNPHYDYASIHVAGTNGKGSVAAMTQSMLATRRRVGLYTSPHLISFTERIRVDGVAIAEEEVVGLVDEIRALTEGASDELTFFEFTTVMALLHFARAGVEVAVVEVGLGGRLDATNVVTGDVAVITSIGLDHEEYLGHTVAAVAAEKAGIIKPGKPVVVGRLPQPAIDVVSAVAAQRGAPLSLLGRDFSMNPGPTMEFEGLGRRIPELRLSLPGEFQRDNAAVAVAALITFERAQPKDFDALPEEEIRRGLAQTSWAGRFEVVAERPRVILDCAHNPEAVAALVNELKPLRSGGKIHLLFAVMRDKQWHEMVALLCPVIDSCTVTTVHPPRGEAVETVAAAFVGVPIESVADPILALQALIARTPPEDTIVVAGSLFLIGAIYPLFSSRLGAASFELNDAVVRSSSMRAV